ncbi:MAG TPA: HAMP domain-containing sensor histidine kinase [Gemmatimonadaceae bacterium]|nr:HAMP domain-containing sensor histidine kinase [Gemmatimonadaceae bacterium]
MRASLSRRPSWPLVLLFGSLGATAIAAMEAHRTVRSQRALAEHALRDYAAFASWSYQQHLREAMSAAIREALGAVNHGDNMHTSPRIPDASEVPHYLPWDDGCSCHKPRLGPIPAAFFGFTLGADTLGLALNVNTHPEHGWLVQPPREQVGIPATLANDRQERRWVTDTLTAQIRAGVRSDWRYNVVAGEWRGQPRLLAYTLMPMTTGDTVVYGATYTESTFASLLGGILDRDGVLPESFTRDRRNRDVVTIAVTDARGHPLYESSPGVAWRFDATSALPLSFGALQVRAQIRPALAGEIIIGGLPKSRLPFLLALLGLSAALGVVAVMQLRREEELSTQRARFVSGVSHELRTPLAQIRLYLETLRLGRFRTDAQRERSLEQIDRETRRLAHLVENVLRFSRRGTPAPDDALREPVDVASEVQDVTNEFALLAAARRATIAVDVRGQPQVVMVPGTLRQILINLLDNAVKYGPPEQTVRVAVEGDARTARIEVLDEGPGIPSSEREEVFQPFRRGRAAASSGAGGSGIGLTIVREIVAAHGGAISVTDSQRGARIVVELPAVGVNPGVPEGISREPSPATS